MAEKKTKVAPIPRGFRTLTPHVTTTNVSEAVTMYQLGLDATLMSSQTMPDSDDVVFALLRIGNSHLTIGQGETYGFGAVSLHLYVEDAEAVWDRMLEAGCAVIHPLKERYWGDKTGLLSDPLGVHWSIGQQVARLSAKEKKDRALAAMKAAGTRGSDTSKQKDADAAKAAANKAE